MMLSKIDKKRRGFTQLTHYDIFSSCGGSRQLHLVNGLK